MPSFTEMKVDTCGLCKGERDGECVWICIYIYVYIYTYSILVRVSVHITTPSPTPYMLKTIRGGRSSSIDLVMYTSYALQIHPPNLHPTFIPKQSAMENRKHLQMPRVYHLPSPLPSPPFPFFPPPHPYS